MPKIPKSVEESKVQIFERRENIISYKIIVIII